MKRLLDTIRIYPAIKFEGLRSYFLNKNEQEKLTMIEFRYLALFFGFDTSDMSDQEIKENVSIAAKEISKTGLTASEAAEAFKRISLLISQH